MLRSTSSAGLSPLSAASASIHPSILDALGLPAGSSVADCVAAIQALQGEEPSGAAPGAPMAAASRLTARELRFCSEKGVSPELFYTTKQEMRSRGGLSAREQAMLSGQSEEARQDYLARKTALVAAQSTTRARRGGV